MAGVGATLLCCVLLAAAGGLRLCRGLEVLRGLQGQSVSFPAPLPASADIARVIWRNWETHIAEAKPRKNRFNADYLPGLRGRLFLHPTRLSLEIRPLQLEDSGPYQVIVDTFSEPTNPKNSSYFLIVHAGSPEMTPGTDEGGYGGSTAGPWGATEPRAGDATTQGAGGGQPPGDGRGPGVCEARGHYCVVKGYLVATILGLLLMLVAAVHVVTRDKATELGDEVSAGPRVGSEPPGISTPWRPAPWQR